MLLPLQVARLLFVTSFLSEGEALVQYYQNCNGKQPTNGVGNAQTVLTGAAGCLTLCQMTTGCKGYVYNSALSLTQCSLLTAAPTAFVTTSNVVTYVLAPSPFISAVPAGTTGCTYSTTGTGCAASGGLVSGVVRTATTISTPYKNCVAGAMRAYQCCLYRSQLPSATPVTQSTPCGTQYAKDVDNCNLIADNTSCSDTALSTAANRDTCCSTTLAAIHEGIEGPQCQYGTQSKLKLKRMERRYKEKLEHAELKYLRPRLPKRWGY